MFLIWMCTRPAAAVVMLFISVSGQLLIPSGNPILLLLWLLVTFGGGWAYFLWLPEVYRDRPLDKPFWVQVNPKPKPKPKPFRDRLLDKPLGHDAGRGDSALLVPAWRDDGNPKPFLNSKS
jgi:hypothetical protein